jgi:hypothetical protein
MESDLFEWLERLLTNALDGSTISEWERSFLKDQAERVEKYRDDVRMSPKQWGVLDRVADKIGMEGRPGA